MQTLELFKNEVEIIKQNLLDNYFFHNSLILLNKLKIINFFLRFSHKKKIILYNW